MPTGVQSMYIFAVLATRRTQHTHTLVKICIISTSRNHPRREYLYTQTSSKTTPSAPHTYKHTIALWLYYVPKKEKRVPTTDAEKSRLEMAFHRHDVCDGMKCRALSTTSPLNRWWQGRIMHDNVSVQHCSRSPSERTRRVYHHGTASRVMCSCNARAIRYIFYSPR